MQATVTADSNGFFTFTPTVSTDGLVRIIADTTTAANLQSTGSTTLFFTADVTPPTVSITLNDDTSGGAGITSDPTLAVTTKPNSVVTFSEGSVQLGSVTTNAAGFATFDPQGFSDGLQTITAQATDVAGLVGPAANFSFTLDTDANPDGLLDLATNGTGDGFYTYDVTDGSTQLRSAIVDFSDGYGDTVRGQPDDAGTGGVVDFSTLLLGLITATVTATDVAGNVATVTQGDVFTLDLSNDTALAPGLLVTSAPLLYGYAAPGMTVSLNDGAGVVATTTAVESGVFSFFRPSLATGTYVLTASGTDADGNTDSDQLNVVVFDTDTTGATLSINAPASTIGSHQFTVTGQASASEAGNIVYLEAPNFAVRNFPYTDIVGYGTIGANGSWQVTASVTTDGTYSYEALVVAANGQQTESAAQSFVVQTMPANGVSITDGGATVTGSSYDLTGSSSVPNAYLEIQLSNGEYTLFQANSSGNWSYDLPVGSGPGYLNGSYTFSPVVISAGPNSITVSLTYDQNFNPISGSKATTTLIVATNPTVASIVAEPDSGEFNSGADITLTMTMGDDVTVTGTPVLTLNDGGTATYLSGSGTDTLVFTTTVANGENAAALAVTGNNLNGSSIAITDAGTGKAADLSGADASFTGLSIGATVASITAATPASDLGPGQKVVFTVTMSEAVKISGGAPYLTLNNGGEAKYSGGSGSDVLTFTYMVGTLGSGQDVAALAVSGFNANGATIYDSNVKADTADLSGVTAFGSGPQIDTTRPTVTSITTSGDGITDGNGELWAGSTVTLTVNFSAVVTVAGGTPTLRLPNKAVATYAGGSGSDALTFTYVVGNGQKTADLAVTSLLLNGATIADGAGIKASLAGAATSLPGILQIGSGPRVIALANGETKSIYFNADGTIHDIAYACVSGQAYTSYDVLYGTNNKPATA